MHRLDSGLPKEGPLLVIWRDKLDRWVIVRQAIPARVDELSIVLGNDREVFIALVHAHHVLHWVRVRLCQSAVAMPVCYNANVQEVLHDARQLHIFLQNSRWILKWVVIVVLAVFFPALLKELTERKVYSARTLCKVSESIIILALGVDDFITCLLYEVCLIIPKIIRLLELAILFE